jgi:hypothetical protein
MGTAEAHFQIGDSLAHDPHTYYDAPLMSTVDKVLEDWMRRAQEPTLAHSSVYSLLRMT